MDNNKVIGELVMELVSRGFEVTVVNMMYDYFNFGIVIKVSNFLDYFTIEVKKDKFVYTNSGFIAERNLNSILNEYEKRCICFETK